MNTYRASWINAWLTIKSDGQKMLLGVFWVFFEPLFVSLVMTAILSEILKQQASEYFSYVFIGKVMFIYFSKNASLATIAIRGNLNIISNIKVKPIFLVMSSVHRVTIQMAMTALILFFYAYSVFDASMIELLNLIFIAMIFYTFIIAICFILAILGIVLPDLSALISILILPLMFVSGVFFSVDEFGIDSRWINILSYNPIYILITDARDIIFNHNKFILSFYHFYIVCLSCLVIIGLTVFSNIYRAHLTDMVVRR